MHKDQLKEAIKDFEKSSNVSAAHITDIRNEIFNSFDKGDIMDSQKNKLLKELYRVASDKKMFFVSIMDRKPENLPKEEEVDEEESYEEPDEPSYSYSYDEEDEEEEDDKA